MSLKRKNTPSVVAIKKQKKEETGFPFPKEIAAEIGSFLYGRDLLNFKLVSKIANEVSKERSCYVKITNENYGKAIGTSGIHVTSVKDGGNWWFDLFKLDASRVQELIVDFKDYPEDKTEGYGILDYIEKLKELRRCKITNADIPFGPGNMIAIREDSKLDDLDIHSLNVVNLRVYRKIERVRINQTNENANVCIFTSDSELVKHYQYSVKGKVILF